MDKQVKHMDAVVVSIGAGCGGPASTAYREFHRAAAEDAVRIREVLRVDKRSSEENKEQS
ncbi:hypothetical protein ABZX93_17325 [Streptomyces sp. NPDC006632]|uniref:hypothetical protein n=1 Tax=Streptomyces sp. NPDC006632 TaxID=3157182 RepID=UPI0033B890DB